MEISDPKIFINRKQMYTILMNVKVLIIFLLFLFQIQVETF